MLDSGPGSGFGPSELVIDIVEVRPSGTRGPGPTKPLGTRWWVPALAGAAAFWLANLTISMTPVAAGCRSALSIPHLPMLLEAAAGGLVIAGEVALLLTRCPDRVPGPGPLRKAMLVVGALILLTVLVEMPSKLRSDVADSGYWLFVATEFKAVRLLALGVTFGLVTRWRTPRQDPHHLVTRREAHS